MKGTNYYLDQVAELDRQEGGTGSDYAVAKRLGITPQWISQLRSKRRRMGDETCLVIAEILGLSYGEVLINSRAERARSEKVREAWEKLAERIRGTAAAIAFAIIVLPGLVAYPGRAGAEEISAGTTVMSALEAVNNIHYAHNTNHVRSDEGPLISRVHVMIEPRPQHARHLRVRAWVGRAQRACSSPFLSCGRSSWSPNADYQRRLAPGSRPGR